MKNSTCLEHFLISLYMSFSLITQITIAQNIVPQTCKHTPNPNLCISTFKSVPASSTSDVSGLTKIGSDILLRQASSTKAKIRNLLKSARDQQLIKSLKCSEDAYDFIIKYDLPEVVEAVTKGDPKFGQDGARDIAVEADSSSKCFSKTTSPIYNQDKFVHDFALVLSSIIQMLL